MNLELTIEELGLALKKIEAEYNLNILIKSNLSGGWMTINGEAKILNIPISKSNGCSTKGNNIIDVKIKNENQDGVIVKITGAVNKKFNINISNGKYRELRTTNININQIKINKNECKLRIDEDIIFTIKASEDEVMKIIQS